MPTADQPDLIRSTASTTTLRQPWLNIARVLWIVLSAAALVALIVCDGARHDGRRCPPARQPAQPVAPGPSAGKTWRWRSRPGCRRR